MTKSLEKRILKDPSITNTIDEYGIVMIDDPLSIVVNYEIFWDLHAAGYLVEDLVMSFYKNYYQIKPIILK